MSEETRLFSQEELDKIISDRLKQERAKFARELAQKEAELRQRETMLTARVDWERRGLPADLLDVLDMSKENVIESAGKILETLTKENRIFPNGGFAPVTESRFVGNDEDAAIRAAMGLNRKDE